MDTRNRLCRADSILKRSTATRQRKRSRLKLNYKLNPTFITRILPPRHPKKSILPFIRIFLTQRIFRPVIFHLLSESLEELSSNDGEVARNIINVNGILFWKSSFPNNWFNFSMIILLNKEKLLFRYRLLFFHDAIIWINGTNEIFQIFRIKNSMVFPLSFDFTNRKIVYWLWINGDPFSFLFFFFFSFIRRIQSGSALER